MSRVLQSAENLPATQARATRSAHRTQQQHTNRKHDENSPPDNNMEVELPMSQLLLKSTARDQPMKAMDVDDKTQIGVASWRKGQGFRACKPPFFAMRLITMRSHICSRAIAIESARGEEKGGYGSTMFVFLDTFWQPTRIIPSNCTDTDFYDYYFDFISYLGKRRGRLDTFEQDMARRKLAKGSHVYNSEFSSYAGRERVLLRKRRTKLKTDAFHIITQVGQGGYGEVYMARHKETNVVCALKKMKKATLAKMDEVKHILVERDILTNTKSDWLVKLLYSFQDKEHVYLAMVCPSISLFISSCC